MHDVLTIGSSVVDIFIDSDEFELETESATIHLTETKTDKISVDQLAIHPGGGGHNTAVGFAMLGYRTGVITETGKDNWSQLIMESLVTNHIDTNYVVAEKKEQTGGSVIISDPQARRIILVYRGASSQLDPVDIPQSVVASAGWIHLSSISGRVETLKLIFQIVKKEHRQLSWNPGSAELELLVAGRLPVAEIPYAALLVNDQEWQQLEPLHDELLQGGGKIVVTKGRQGGQVYSGGKVEHEYTVHPAQPVNETGAGDSFAVGFVAGMMAGHDTVTCVEYGKRNAANVVQHMGATGGLLTKEQLEAA